MSKKIGILTGGGDCPGLNAVIRAVVRKSIRLDYQVIGLLQGWRGLMDYGLTEELNLDKVSGIIHRGGTILKTSRTNPFKEKDGVKRILEKKKSLGLSAVIAVGGEDTLSVASRLYEEEGMEVVGVPKTIDNDIWGTDYTFGFDTAINIAMEAIDRVHTTAESHNRVIVVEVMGRHTGWIAIEAGIAGGADFILIPEKPVDLDKVCDAICKRHARGRTFSVVVVAEGAKIAAQEEDKVEEVMVVQDEKLDAFGHVRLGGIGKVLATEIEKRTGYETRFVILGYIQRGGTPTAFDRMLGSRFGVAAVDLVHRGEFGKMVSLRGNEIITIDLKEALSKTKRIDDDLYEMAEVFFG